MKIKEIPLPTGPIKRDPSFVGMTMLCYFWGRENGGIALQFRHFPNNRIINVVIPNEVRNLFKKPAQQALFATF
jgi:hypothetical protein